MSFPDLEKDPLSVSPSFWYDLPTSLTVRELWRAALEGVVMMRQELWSPSGLSVACLLALPCDLGSETLNPPPTNRYRRANKLNPFGSATHYDQMHLPGR